MQVAVVEATTWRARETSTTGGRDRIKSRIKGVASALGTPQEALRARSVEHADSMKLLATIAVNARQRDAIRALCNLGLKYACSAAKHLGSQ